MVQTKPNTIPRSGLRILATTEENFTLYDLPVNLIIYFYLKKGIYSIFLR